MVSEANLEALEAEIAALAMSWRIVIAGRWAEAARDGFWAAVDGGANEGAAMRAGIEAAGVAAHRERLGRVKAPVQRDDWIGRILRERDRRRKRREPATRRRWAIMARPKVRACELVPPPWWGVLSAREPGGYDAGEEWAAMEGPCPL